MVYGLTTFAIMLILSSCASSVQEEDVAPIVPKPVITIADEVPEIGDIAEDDGEETEEEAFSILSAEGGLQSAVLTLSYPRSADLSLLSLEGGGYITRIEAAGGTAEICIAGLESLSAYTLTLLYDGLPATGPMELMTGSFEGRYSWTPAAGSDADPFVLSVRKAPSGSAYRYHIYLDPEDSAFPEGYDGDIRIAPLVDEGEPSLDGMRYEDAPASYRWTNEKWNKGSMEPSKIRYVKAVATPTGDEIHTLIASVALGFTAEADVRYEFHEDGDTAYLAFHNRMDPDIANGFLIKNPSPGIRPYESDEHWFVLERE